MLTLVDYGSLLHLDEPFLPPPPQISLQDAARSVDRLLARLLRHDGSARQVLTGLSPRQALYAALIARPARPFPDGFLEELDVLLSLEAAVRPRVAVAALPQLHPSLALWKGDITTLQADAIVNAANSALLGCFQPFHACIDNCIHAAAGPRLRADCQRIMERQNGPEVTRSAKLTRAYHLPARYVIHTVGPIYSGDPAQVPHDMHHALASSYRSCLELAAAVSGIRSLAFCCISTGVFGFPGQPAAAIAIETVSRWLADHPGRLDRVIFNVFTNQDEKIYRSLLKRSRP